MKTCTLIVAVALIALFYSPVMASDSVQLSNERGTATQMRGSLSVQPAPAVATTDAGSVQKVSIQKDTRGYFKNSAAIMSDPGQSIRQSRENGGN